jgi:hypothetical protein
MKRTGKKVTGHLTRMATVTIPKNKLKSKLHRNFPSLASQFFVFVVVVVVGFGSFVEIWFVTKSFTQCALPLEPHL